MTINETIRQYSLAQEGGPYIYGATAARCTPSYRRARMQQYPDVAPKIKELCPVLNGSQGTCSGCKHEGRLAHDCAQLTRKAAEAAGLRLPSGSKNQFMERSPHSGWAAGGTIDRLPLEQVAFLYRKKTDGSVPHTGVYTGDGWVVDARGHAQGVVRSLLHAYKWTDFRVLKGQELAPGVPLLGDVPEINSEVIQVVRDLMLVPGEPMMRGQDVLDVQAALIRLGYSVGPKGADGYYGRDTEEGVAAFQQDHSLKVNGVWGRAERELMAELLAISPPADPPAHSGSVSLTLPCDAAVALAKALREVI